MVRGVFFALSALGLWALAFVLPLFVLQFSSAEIALGRLIAYGIVSLFFALIKHRGTLLALPWLHWRMSAVFSITSNLLYSLCLVVGIRYIGGAFSAALYSILPIVCSIYGNFCHKVYPWKRLALPLTGIFLGLLFMHLGAIPITPLEGQWRFAFGVGATLSSILLWSWYSVRNALFLHRHSYVELSDWVSLMGIFSLVGSLLGVALLLLFYPESLYVFKASAQEIRMLLFISFFNGIFVNWLTNFLWNNASRLLPIAFLSQLYVFEILFGLFYVYLKERTPPTTLEIMGIACVIFALSFSFRRVPQLKPNPTTS